MESESVLVHLRFAPDGSVTEISQRPAALSPQAWYNFLSYKAATAYQPLAGGRGVFRLSRNEIDKLQAEAVPGAA